MAPAGSAQPAPPLVSVPGSASSHFVEVPFHGSFQVHYDVRSVPGATGAAFEVGAAGPTNFNNYNAFNNPNGSQRDNNGSDFGSVAFVPLPGKQGTVKLNSAALGMYPTMNHSVRVLAMRGGAVVGEASGVSSASMDGVAPADGGTLVNGYAINGHGTDGFLTSDQLTASGQILGSVQTFDQSTNAITKTVVSSSEIYGTLIGGCPGLFHGDVGLYDDVAPTAGTFRVLNPVASGTQAGTWTPADSELDGLLCPAANQTTDDTAVLAATRRTSADLSGVRQQRPGRTRSGRTARSSPPSRRWASRSQAASREHDDRNRRGGVGRRHQPRRSWQDRHGQPGRRLAEFRAGGDERLHRGRRGRREDERAVAGSLVNGFGIYNLASGTSTAVTPGGATYQRPVIDSTRSRIAIEEVAGPDFLGQTSNNNALSSVLTVDEQGKVLSGSSGSTSSTCSCSTWARTCS